MVIICHNPVIIISLHILVTKHIINILIIYNTWGVYLEREKERDRHITGY